MVVFITGTSSGLGKLIAEKFAAQGHKVYGTTRNQAKQGEKTSFANGFIETVTLDVNSDDSCKNAVNYVLNKEPVIDILINNAGFGVAGALELTSDEEAYKQFETNFFGALRMMRHVLPTMRKNKAGKIINITSVAAMIPIPFQSLYSAGKSALEIASQALFMEIKPFNIKITCAEFGDMKTGFTSNRETIKAAAIDKKNSRVYSDIFTKSLAVMEKDELNGPEPIKAAAFIYKLGLKKNPKPVVVFGFNYKVIVLLRRWLPLRFTNWLIGRLYT